MYNTFTYDIPFTEVDQGENKRDDINIYIQSLTVSMYFIKVIDGSTIFMCSDK